MALPSADGVTPVLAGRMSLTRAQAEHNRDLFARLPASVQKKVRDEPVWQETRAVLERGEHWIGDYAD